MHRCAAALLVVSIMLISGCVSGQTAKRQAAEPGNLSLQDAPDYGEDAPEERECTCPDSMRTCQDGFVATCENACGGGSCGRCMPTCLGHEACNESWFCGEWQTCSGSTQARVCIDRNGCNSGERQETRPCPDLCSSDADCPSGPMCSPYVCSGSPKACKQTIIVPCCGDGLCEGNENSTCLPDCPAQENQSSSQQQNHSSQNQTGNGTANQTTYTYCANVTITNITYKAPEFVVIDNSGNGSAVMDNWTLSDNATTPHTFKFPAFVLLPNSFVKIHTEDGTNNGTDIFWGTSSVWNDKGGDVAYLRDKNSTLISVYSYIS